MFKQHLTHALGSCAETQNWLDFGLECKYIDQKVYEDFTKEIDQVGKMLTKLHQNWKSYEK